MWATKAASSRFTRSGDAARARSNTDANARSAVDQRGAICTYHVGAIALSNRVMAASSPAQVRPSRPSSSGRNASAPASRWEHVGERHELSWRGLNPGDELFKQGGLAGTGLAGQTYGTNPAGSNSVEVLLQDSKFIVATQKWPLHRSQGGPRRHGRQRWRARLAGMRLLSSAAFLPSCRVDCDPTASPQSRLCRHRRCLAASARAGAPAGLRPFPSAERCVRRSSGNRRSPSTSRPGAAGSIHDTDVTVRAVNHRSARFNPTSAGGTPMDDRVRHAPFAA